MPHLSKDFMTFSEISFVFAPKGLFESGELDPLELASFDPNEYHIPFA